jgi:Tol biopolymer transport system component
MARSVRFAMRAFSRPRGWICALVIMLVVAGWRAEGQTAKSGSVGEKVWADGTSDHTGHISADGRFLTFVNWAAAELWIRDLSNRTNRPLVSERSGYYGSFISPDGTQVAYNWSSGATPALSIVPLAGGTPRQIQTGLGYPSWVHGWAPDGRELLVINTEALDMPADIGFLNVSTAQFRRIGTVEPGTSAKLSPDGSRIVVSELAKPDRTQRDVRIIDVASGRSQPLLTGPADDYSPDWSPDGKTVYFLSDRDNKPRLWKLPLAQGMLRPEPVSEIPDGDDRIIGVTRDGRIFVGGYDIGGTNSYVADVDWRTGDVRRIRQLANAPLRGSRRAVLSPNGEQVAFLRRPRGYGVRPGWQIPVVQPVDGRGERVYDTTLTIRDEPVWFPDGSALLFPVPPEGSVGNAAGRRWRFLRLDLQQGTYTEIGTTAAEGQVRLAGLRGDDVFYLLMGAGGSRVMALNVKTGATRELYSQKSAMADAAVVPDGQRIVFAAGEPGGGLGVFIASLTAPHPERVVAMRPYRGAQVMWFSDGEAILTSGRIDDQSGIWRISLKGSPPVRLKLDFDDVTEVRASMDGRRIAFTRTFQREREVWEYRVDSSQ